MAIIKCKMCGGDLEITEGSSVAECEYCGTKQTVPNVDNEKKVTLFGRANRLRLACEFDKAAGIYENLVAEFPEEAEAYWGLVLCRYGIEYVDDPATGKKVPTCHRSSFESILEDTDFEQACENADAVARKVYREEAKTIENIRRGILEVSGKEPPYDIFICYKETDADGNRTIDSVLAQDVYVALTGKGYRVFFSRITLEDKLGTEYEPYIFAALNSAKLMLVFGTDYEYFNAVWVKNEWSRFLKLMAQDKTKHLIPCYKDVDAYDMPKEFAKFQAQDLGKVGAMQDLLWGIDKLLKSGEPHPTPRVPLAVAGPTAESILRRGQMFLEDEDWKNAGEYFDRVLDINPECAEAWVGKLCVDLQYTALEQITEGHTVDLVTGNPNYRKIVQFANENLKAKLVGYLECIKKNELAMTSFRGSAQGLLAASSSTTIGLCANGTVVATGDNRAGQCNVSDWQDIVSICVGFGHTVGLRTNGTVVATGDNGAGQCDVSNWWDIASICTDEFTCTAGLRADGTVVATGENTNGQCNVSDWQDIVAVSLGGRHTVGLRADGTVVATGLNSFGQCNVSGWQDIVAVRAGGDHTVGLRADGTVVATGHNKYGQFNNVSDWHLFSSPKDMMAQLAALRQRGEKARQEENQRRQEEAEWHRQEEEKSLREAVELCYKEGKERRERARVALEEEKSSLQTELSKLKGLFSGKRRKEIETRLVEIEAELKKL